ncbi:MAG: WD40 repeat domain-containing protein, partial [Cyanobacteria bacterium P01_F01_bin.153]
QSLEEVIADCGPKQSKLAWLVLGLLTGENSIRPLKTRIELEQDLVQLGYFSEDDLEKERCESYETLSLVLDILVASGLVFFVPDEPVHCYQLVHDYLVQLIRDRQGSAIERLRDNLSRERLLRRRKELQLTRVLKQRLRWAIASGIALCGLLTFSSYMAYLNWREASNERYLADSLQVENQAQRQAAASIIAAQSGGDPAGDRPSTEPPNILAGDSAAEDGTIPESTESPDNPPRTPESELPSGTGENSAVPSREALLENLSKLLDRDPTTPNPTLAAQIDITHSATLAQLLDPLVKVPDVDAVNPDAANPNVQMPIQDLAWQPGGNRFGLIDATGSARVYSQEGELLFTLDSVSRGRSLQLLWSPDGEGLLTRHSSGVVVLWDQEGNPQASLRIPALITSSTAVPWAWTGQQLAIAHPRRRRLWIWDTATDRLDRDRSPKSTLQLPAISHSLAWQPSGSGTQTLAIGLANGTIVTTTDRETLNANAWLAGDQPVTALAWLPENFRSDRPQKQRLVSVGSTIILWSGDGKAVHISDWPAAFPRSFPVKGQTPPRQASRPLPQQILQWQPQGNLLTLLTSPAENRPQGIGVWQLDSTGDTLTWVRSLDYSQGLLSAVTWRSDGSMLLTGDRTGAVRRWPLRRSVQKQLLCDETSHCPQ